jgi:MFS transporter, ACS family, hexuronate transporter
MTDRGRWTLCWLLFAATALSFLDRQVLSILAPAITAEFGMDNAAYSRVVAAFQLSYTVMFTLGGRLVDRLGTGFGMGLAVTIWSAASGAHAFVSGSAGLGVARFFLGFGEGACFPAATKGAVEWFPLERRVLAIGIANGGAAFGAVLAPPLTAVLASRFGWRGAFIATGLSGAIWLPAWFWANRSVRRLRAELPLATRPSIQKLLADRRVWQILGSRFLFDPVVYFYLFWIPQYLSQERGFSIQQIGNSFWIPFLALGISNLLAGGISDSLVAGGWPPRKARSFLLAGAAILTTSSWLIPLAGTPGLAIGLMALLLFAHGFWISNFLALIGDTFPSGAVATVTGLSGTAGGTAGILSSLLIGWIVDRISFAPVFAVAGLLYLLAALVLLRRFWTDKRT